MIGSSVLHGAGLVEGGLPPWVRVVALVGIGSLIGARFARMMVKTLLRHVNAGLGAFAIAIVISGVFVALIALSTQVRVADIIVAFAPGAMTPCCAGADPAYRSDLRRRASSIAFRVRDDRNTGHRPSVGRPQEDVDD